MKTEKYDQFVSKVFKIGNSFAVIIPSRNMEYSGLNKGDYVKMWYQKVENDKV